MLHFHELAQLLDQKQEERLKFHEALTDDMRQKLAALKGQVGAQRGAPATAPAPADMKAPAPAAAAPRPAAPAAAPSPAPPAEKPADAGAPPAARALVRSSDTNPDVNDPNHPGYANKSRVMRGAKPSQASKSAQVANPTGRRLEYATQKLMDFNNFLASPSYRMATEMMAAEQGLHLQFPEGQRFRLSPNPTGEENEVVVGGWQPTMKLIKAVNDYLGTERGTGEKMGPAHSLKAAIAQDWTSKPQLKPIILRALKFEKVLFDPKFAGQEMTIQALAQTLGQQVGGGGDLIDRASGATDMTVLRYIIEKAQQHGFGKHIQVQGDLRDPQAMVKIVPLEEFGAGHDPLSDPSTGRYPSLNHQVRARMAQLRGGQPGGQPQPGANEHTNEDWTDVLDMMEHWGLWSQPNTLNG